MEDQEKTNAEREPEILLPPDLEKKLEYMSASERIEPLYDGKTSRCKECPVFIIIMTIFFTIVAIVLMIVGFVIAENKFSKALPCWIIASLMMIPVGYCYSILIKAYYADPKDRKRILEEIPDI